MDWSKIDNSPAALRSFLEAEGLAPKKRFGQNFMISPGARRSVVHASDVKPGDLVWEVGPGLGAITAMLVEVAGHATVFEIDHGIMAVLRRRFADRVTIVAGDAVKTLRQAGENPGGALPDIVVGNLPYRSAAAIVATLLETGPIVEHARRMVFTVQREMAQRMTASPGQKDYSPLTVLCALSGQVKLESDLAGGSFFPVPEVVSSLVSVVPGHIDQQVLRVASISARSLFTSRRKTIRNNLGTLASSTGLPLSGLREALGDAGVGVGLRAEALTPDTYLALAERLVRMMG